MEGLGEGNLFEVHFVQFSPELGVHHPEGEGEDNAEASHCGVEEAGVPESNLGDLLAADELRCDEREECQSNGLYHRHEPERCPQDLRLHNDGHNRHQTIRIQRIPNTFIIPQLPSSMSPVIDPISILSVHEGYTRRMKCAMK